MPGIILWMVLVVAAAGGDTEKRAKKFAERMIHGVAMFIGMQSQELVVSMLRAFLGVQRWVGGRDERAFEEKGKRERINIGGVVLGEDQSHEKFG